MLQHGEIRERAEAEVQEVACDLGSGRDHPGRDRPHNPGSPETGPHSVPIRHTRSCEAAQQAEVAEGRRSRPLIVRKDEAATSETEVLIDIRLSYRLQSKIVIAEMHSHPAYHSASRSIIHAANLRWRGK